MNCWCCLCGSLEATLNLEGDILEETLGLLQLQTRATDRIACSKCVHFLNDVNTFRVNTTAIQHMFDEIQQDEELTNDQIIDIRSRYGLEIKLENLPEEEMLADDGEEDDRSEYVLLADTEFNEECTEDDVESELDEGEKSKPVRSRKTYKTRTEKSANERLYEFKCHVCNEEFIKMKLLSEHCRSEHQQLPRVLCWCGTFLSTWKRLMTHKSKHIEEKDVFKCDLCNITYKTRVAFEKHVQMKHGPDAVKFVCSQCGKQFKEKQILKNHLKVHLPDELKLKYPCSYCSKKFVNSHCLKIHVARIHDKIALHTCELCGKGCITSSDLRWHMDKHIEERNFECDICNLRFKSTNSLRIHKRRHSNQDKVVACGICSKQFHSSAALSNHKLVHSDVKRYKCFCGNEYKRLESYKCHLSVHSGERPFNCPWCNRTFVNSANCRKHKLKDHPLEVLQHEAVHGKRGVPLANKAPPAK